jgi:threonine/homoserine/homoserine lactone efflux protein
VIDPLPFATYSFVMSITPGPNNVMLTSSGANFGFRRTVPHLLGICVGLAVEMVAVCAGLGAVFARWPSLQVVLSWAGAAYLIYMGWKLLWGTGGAKAATTASARPITFFEAAVFQFLNPKAWVMSLTAVALFLPTDWGVVRGSAYVVGLMAAVNLPSVAVWAVFGSSLRRFLEQPSRRLIFNGVMALALVVTAVMMVL